MQNVTGRNRTKMPAARPSKNVPDVPQNINVAFRRQLLNPDGDMLQEQYWRQTGIGGKLTFDGGGNDGDTETLSEGEIEMDDDKPSEPQMLRIREYESPGRKVSRDVQVVNQGQVNTEEAKVVPHFFLPNSSGTHLQVPGDKRSRLPVPEKRSDKHTSNPPSAEVGKRKSNEPQNFHIREYDSPGRKISRDVRVVNQGHSRTENGSEPKVVPHMFLPVGNNKNRSHLQVPYDEPDKPLRVSKDKKKKKQTSKPPSVDGGKTKSNEPQNFHIREYDSPGRKVSRDVRVVNHGHPSTENGSELKVVPHMYLPITGDHRTSHLQVPHAEPERKSHLSVPQGDERQSSKPSSAVVEYRDPNEPQKFHIREYDSPGRKISRDVHVVNHGHPNTNTEPKVVPHMYLTITDDDRTSQLQVPHTEPDRTSLLSVPEDDERQPSTSPEAVNERDPNEPQTFHIREYDSPGRKISRDVRVVNPVPPNTELAPQHLLSTDENPSYSSLPNGPQTAIYIPNTVSQSVSRDHSTVHLRQYDGPQRKISYDVKVENPVVGSRDEGYGTEGPQLAYYIGSDNGQSQGQDAIYVPETHSISNYDQGQGLPPGQSAPSVHVPESLPEHNQDENQVQNPPVHSQGPVYSNQEESQITERTLYLDTTRTSNSLPQSSYRRNLEDYYSFDQPRGSIVDARSYQNAKRASRASVLSKAELLLNARRLEVLNENSSDDDVQFSVRSRPRRRNSPYKRGGHSTDTEVVRKVKVRQTTLTSPEYESMPSPRPRKNTYIVPKRTQYVPKRGAIVPRRQAFVRKRPIKNKSEPPQVSEGEDDGNTEANRKGGPKGGRRFEDAADGASSIYTERVGPKHHSESQQGVRVAFYNFKEKSSPAAIESVSRQRFPRFDSLLDLLTSRLQIEKGANFIYHWPSLFRIRDIYDFEQEGTYIVASTAMKKSAIEAVYGKLGPKQWHNGKVKHNDSSLIRKPPSGHDSPQPHPKKKPMIVTLVCNSSGKVTKVILNTNSHFEDLMTGQITDAVMLDHPPATAMYAFNDGIVGAEVRSLSQLVRDYRNYDTFLVCGKEVLPAPISYSSDSYRPPVRYRRRYPPGADSAPPRVDIAEINGESSPRSSGVQNGYQPPDRHVVKLGGRRRGNPRAPEHEFYSSTVYDGEEEVGKPNRKLMLDWVYGYRGNDRHRNLDILDTGELIYFVAAVVVMYDRQKHLQRFYTEHNEDITCLAVHPHQNRVATGQMQGKGPDHAAHIRIWDVDSLSTISVLGLRDFQGGIIAISFSDYQYQHSSYDFMMAVDESFRHALTVWDLHTEKMIGKTTTNTEAVTGGCFYPNEDDILITYGRQHLYFWRLDWDPSGNPYAKILRDKLSGCSDLDDIPATFTSITFTSNGDVITGDSNGSIMIWQRDNNSVFTLSRQTSENNTHQNAVTSLTPFGDGQMLSGGGSEIYLWDVDNGLTNRKKIQIGITGNIQTLVPSHTTHEDAVIYVGTDRNCIFEGYIKHKFSPLVQGHSGESAVIAVHPTEPAFITAGRGIVIKWSASCHMCIWKTRLEGEKCTAVAIDPGDRMVALGTKSGKVTLLNYTNRGREENTMVIGAKRINSVSFSPDGLRLGIAVDDGYLHICSVDKGTIGRLHATSNVQGQAITNIDWSLDCRHLQTSTNDFQVFFWNVDKKPKIVPGQKLREVDFVTHKSLVSHSILGPWQNLGAGETIKSVDRTNFTQKELLVTGDNMGRLRLYNYPCSSPDSQYRTVKHYSGSLNSVVFSGDDMFVFSSASTVSNGELRNHLGIMQWAVVDADANVLPEHHYPHFCSHNYPHHYNSHYPFHYPKHYNHHKHNYPVIPHPHQLPAQYAVPYYPPHHPYFKRYQ